jgi:hypothetical protein
VKWEEIKTVKPSAEQNYFREWVRNRIFNGRNPNKMRTCEVLHSRIWPSARWNYLWFGGISFRVKISSMRYPETDVLSRHWCGGWISNRIYWTITLVNAVQSKRLQFYTVLQNSWPYFTASFEAGFPFCLLRFQGWRWRYCNPPTHGGHWSLLYNTGEPIRKYVH